MNLVARLFPLALALTACTHVPQIHHEQLAQLDKGMPKLAVAQRLGLGPLAEYRAEADGRSFVFHQYRMNNGVQLDRYLVAYENDKVLYWGYVSEFRRHPDAAMGQALSKVLPAVMALQ